MKAAQLFVKCLENEGVEFIFGIQGEENLDLMDTRLDSRTVIVSPGTMVILIWSDGGYGLIEWKLVTQFQRASRVGFADPDFVKYAESFGAKGYRALGRAKYRVYSRKRRLSRRLVLSTARSITARTLN